MNLLDILKLFRQGKSTARSHIKNLIEMALIDGNFDLIEFNLLQRIAKRNNLTEDHIKHIQENPTTVDFSLPEDSQEKFQQFYDLVHMMTVDNSIHDEEMNLCNLFAVKFGYPREKTGEIIFSIQSNIAHGQGGEEAFKRLRWMLD